MFGQQGVLHPCVRCTATSRHVARPSALIFNARQWQFVWGAGSGSGTLHWQTRSGCVKHVIKEWNVWAAEGVASVRPLHRHQQARGHLRPLDTRSSGRECGALAVAVGRCIGKRGRGA